MYPRSWSEDEQKANKNEHAFSLTFSRALLFVTMVSFQVPCVDQVHAVVLDDDIGKLVTNHGSRASAMEASASTCRLDLIRTMLSGIVP